MNVLRYQIWLIGFLFLVCPVSYLLSQFEHQDHPWWVDLGAGPSLIGKTFSMNAGMIYCYQFEHSVLSARLIGVTNKNPTALKIDPSPVQYKFSDYGFLYGPLWQWEQSYISVGAGIGLVRVAYETPASIMTKTTVSLPLEVQWFWRPTRFAGIGLYTYTSLNFEKHLFGVLLCAQLGMW
jgi:hypothetical protein